MPKDKDALLGMLSNRKYGLSWTCGELGMISDEVEPPHRIRLVSCYKVWKDRVFCIPKKVIPREKEMIEERVRRSLFKSAWGPYRNCHLLVPKRNGTYHFIISAVSANRHTLEDSGIVPNVEEFSEAFAGLHIISLIDFYSGYEQKMLPEDIPGLYGLPDYARHVSADQTGTVSYLFSISICQSNLKILYAHLGSSAEIFIDDVGVNGPKSRYGGDEVEGLPGVRRCVMEHLPILDNVLADVERAGATISREKSDWCWNRVKIVGFVCAEAGRWPQASMVDKVWK